MVAYNLFTKLWMPRSMADPLIATVVPFRVVKMTPRPLLAAAFSAICR